MTLKQLLVVATITLAHSSCDKYGIIIPKPGSGDHTKYPSMAEAGNPKVLAVANGITLYNGGFGSSMAQDPIDKSVFYVLTDRGPNVAGTTPNSIIIATPDFHPQVGKFRLKGDQLLLEETLTLKNKKGVELNGLPNPGNAGATGEIPYDINGNTLPTSTEGLDSEGFAIAPDGTFWVSDEYGPHIVHFDRNGKTLVGIMQFPLYNPSSAAIQGSLAIRILTYDISSGKSKQYVYLMENANLQAVSEITAIDKNNFLVLERGSEFGTDANRSTIIKRIYKINIKNATDISDAKNNEAGKLFGGKTVEELKDAATLAANGITPVTKTLVVDLMKDINPVYPHDKAEGLAIINSKLIAVSNDDDFGINGSGGIYQQKILPATNTVDRNRIYFIKLSTPLY